MTKRRRNRPAGTGSSGLVWREDRGRYYWRRVDPRTGRARERSTGQTRVDLAARVAARFEDEFREELAGVKRFDAWRAELAPLAAEWIEEQRGTISDKTLEQKRRQLERALDALKLRVAADLTDLRALQRRLLGLERVGVARRTMRRCFQRPLKQFARWLAGNARCLDRDPLAAWEPVPLRAADKRPTKKRRPAEPDEIARALAAVDVIDARRGRQPQRVTFTALLVTGARVGAFLERDAQDLDAEDGRLDLGPGTPTKRRGDAALDPATLAELVEVLDGRAAGPLCLSPWGARWSKERLLDAWREAFSLGVLDAIWPADEEVDLDLALLVNGALLHGRAPVSRGGNPLRVRPETVQARLALEARVLALAKRLRGDWAARMEGIDVHGFRTTHRTWARAVGVVGEVIDKQLGHAPGEAEELSQLRRIAGSRTGRRHYLGLDSELFDARRSAVAVRELLDGAEAALRDGGGRFLPAAGAERARASS